MPTAVATAVATQVKADKPKKRLFGRGKERVQLDPGMTEGPEILVSTHTEKEWKPLHTTETLPEIEEIIDSWGPPRATSWSATPARVRYAPITNSADLEHRVDYILKARPGNTDPILDEGQPETVETDDASDASYSSDASDDSDALVYEEGPQRTRKARPTKHAGKRNGFFSRFRRGKTQATEETADKREGSGTHKASPGEKDYQPQCSALTDGGLQCRNSARGTSKYCASHKGYHPLTVEGIVRGRDTKPANKSAPDTLPGEEAWEPSEYQAQCSALTGDGMQCRNSSQDGSKFCASHHGYKASKKGFLGKLDTKPRWRKAKDTKPTTRKQ